MRKAKRLWAPSMVAGLLRERAAAKAEKQQEYADNRRARREKRQNYREQQQPPAAPPEHHYDADPFAWISEEHVFAWQRSTASTKTSSTPCKSRARWGAPAGAAQARHRPSGDVSGIDPPSPSGLGARVVPSLPDVDHGPGVAVPDRRGRSRVLVEGDAEPLGKQTREMDGCPKSCRRSRSLWRSPRDIGPPSFPLHQTR